MQIKRWSVIVGFGAVWSVALVAAEAGTEALFRSSFLGNAGTPEVVRVKKQAPFVKDDEWEDATYAGKFAMMLRGLESRDKETYTHFISSGFTENEIPRHLPGPMRVLSRVDPAPAQRVFRKERRPRLFGSPSILGTQHSDFNRIGATIRPIGNRPFLFPKERSRIVSFPSSFNSFQI